MVNVKLRNTEDPRSPYNPPILLTLEETPIYLMTKSMVEKLSKERPNIYPGAAYKPINEYFPKKKFFVETFFQKV